MANGYASSAEGMDWINERFARLEATVTAILGANGAESLVITGPNGITAYDPETGGRANISRGSIWLWDDYDANPENAGQIYCDPGAGINYLRMFPPYEDGEGIENSVTIQGRTPGVGGSVWVYSDNQIMMRVQLSDGTKTGGMHLGADFIEIDANEIRPYNMTSTGGGTPVVMEVVGGNPVLKLSSSAARFKTDIETYEVDPEVALQIRTVLFRDREAVERDGDDAPYLPGVIADELHALGLTHFVQYDETGEVKGVFYDRLWMVVLSLAKHEHAKRVELEAKVQTQAEQIADLTSRLEALEAT